MNLLSVQGWGAVYTLFLFLLCVILVHGIKLAVLGYRSMRKKPPAPAPAEKPQEPVYYLVERKKKRPRSEYSEPRRIKFK